jgi:hypothetical protein
MVGQGYGELVQGAPDIVVGMTIREHEGWPVWVLWPSSGSA